MVANLERAIQIATEAHFEQTRFDGSPYIEHPLRVMKMLELQGHSTTAQIVGVLHDTVEDTDVTYDYLRGVGFLDDVIVPLELLTKLEGDDYEVFIQRLSVNACSRAVKKDDIFDNIDLTGLENPSKRRALMVEKYGKALMYLARFPQPRV
jgi:GTP diphosphokinase / guanosine-3',5'-bis(diphosphate) 3'-diphosphatase